MKALVIGGAGFVGSHLVDTLVARMHEVTVLDDFSTGKRENLEVALSLAAACRGACKVVEGSHFDPDVLSDVLQGSDIVFHFAANADVRFGIEHTRKDLRQNLLSTHLVLEAMRRNGVKRIVLASSGSVYGDAPVIPTPENCPFPIQTSLYGASKVGAEAFCQAYASSFGFDVVILRFVSMLGPRYSHGHVKDFVEKLEADSSRLDILGDGNQKKSYLHVADAIRSIFVILNDGAEALQSSTRKTGHAILPEPSGKIRVFNVGHDEWIDVRTSARVIARAMGLEPLFVFQGGDRGWIGDSPRILLDTSRLKELGWKPAWSIEGSIKETVAYVRGNVAHVRMDQVTRGTK